MTKRYIINDNMIEDTQSDDYYHFNDWIDFKGLCKLANDLYADNKPLQDEMKRMSKDFKEALNEVVKEHNNLLEKNKQLKTDLKQQGILIDSLKDQNQKLKNNLSEIEKIINNRLDPKVVPKLSDGKTELFMEEKVGYFYALEQLKKKLIREDLLFKNEKED